MAGRLGRHWARSWYAGLCRSRDASFRRLCHPPSQTTCRKQKNRAGAAQKHGGFQKKNTMDNPTTDTIYTHATDTCTVHNGTLSWEALAVNAQPLFRLASCTAHLSTASYSSGPCIVPVSASRNTGTIAATSTTRHTANTGCCHLCQEISQAL